jgi:hypothetical protein
VGLAASLAGQVGPAQSQLPPAPVPVPGRATFTPNQLDQLLAPIALYPDPLLGQMLMAATYPLEVVQAARWLQDPAHAALTGDALAAALEPQPWDPSVKALVPFPQVLRMMDGSLDWTAAVGDAFLADGAAVMDAIQRLRLRAQSAGTLVSTPQQTVSSAEQVVIVAPANPEIVYVPVYDPRMVYGSWTYTHYPYFGFPAPVPFGSPVVGGIGFSVGIVIVEPYWGWHDWDWPGRRLHIDVGRFSRLGGRLPPGGAIWQHDPYHRRGVPYRDPGTRARFPGGPFPDTRGYGPGPVTPAPPPGGTPGSFGRLVVPPAPGGRVAPAPGPAPSKSPGRTIFAPTGPGGVPRSLPPAFESFGWGTDIRTQTERGKSSRQIITPPSRPAPAAPRPGTLRSAPTTPPKGAPSGGGRPGFGFRR